jgi:hypothetical protein
MMSKVVKTGAMALAIGGLAACGGSSDLARSTGGISSQTAAVRLPVRISLFVPKALPKSSTVGRLDAATDSVKPSYLPGSVNSVGIQKTESAGAVVPGAPVTILVIGSSDCTASPGGQTCSTVLSGALGQDAWSFKSYVSGNGTGTAVSLNTGTLVVQSGVANVLSLTLNPVLASLALVPISDFTSATATNTLPLVLQADDVTGAIIIGPGTFVTAANVANPITLASSSAAHVVPETSAGTSATGTLSTTASNVLAQVAYDGTLVGGTQTITATATGIATATFTLTLTVPANGLSVPASIALGENLGTTTAALAISEPGYGGNFTLNSSSCAGIVTFPAMAGPGPSTSPTVTQAGGGTCTILVSDGTNSGSVTVYSTTLSVVLQ